MLTYQGAFSDNSLQAHQIAQIVGSQGSGCHVTTAKAAFKSNVKVFDLFDIVGVNATNIFFQSSKQVSINLLLIKL